MASRATHSRYGSSMRGPLHAAAAEQASIEAQNFANMEAEISMNQQLHLVPCRWERSGWRYVQKDPADVGFFNNPNRVNNFGVAAPQGNNRNTLGGSQIRKDSFYNSRSAFSNTKTPTMTTYGRSFVKQK
jgi:hypothetical protein